MLLIIKSPYLTLERELIIMVVDQDGVLMNKYLGKMGVNVFHIDYLDPHYVNMYGKWSHELGLKCIPNSIFT